MEASPPQGGSQFIHLLCQEAHGSNTAATTNNKDTQRIPAPVLEVYNDIIHSLEVLEIFY
jgi:hypothetical protein